MSRTFWIWLWWGFAASQVVLGVLDVLDREYLMAALDGVNSMLFALAATIETYGTFWRRR